MNIDIIVTRHPNLVTYLKNIGLKIVNTRIIDHIDDSSILKDKVVCGVLPHSLSCLCNIFIEVPLILPKELRGKELTVSQIEKYAGKLTAYNVSVKNID